MKTPKLRSSILLLVIGILMVKTQIIIGDGCKGILEGVLFFFLAAVYILVLLIILSISTFEYFKRKRQFNLYPLITTILISAAIFVLFNPEKFEGPTKHYVLMTDMAYGYRLTLKPGGKFVITKKEIEWACFYKGKYSMKGDTLKLFRTDIQDITGNRFSDTYLVEEKGLLYPVDNTGLAGDSTRWLILAQDIDYP